MITIRNAVAADAQQIGAVFDAAVSDGWTYLGDLACQPMFPPEEWDKELAEHAAPNALLVAVDETDRVVGFVAVHPKEGELYLLFVHPNNARRGVGRMLLAAAHEALRAAGCREVFLYTHETEHTSDRCLRGGRLPARRLGSRIRFSRSSPA